MVVYHMCKPGLLLLLLLLLYNNNNNCLKSNIQCIEIRVQWTMQLIETWYPLP